MTGNRLLANHNHDMELNIILNCVTRILIDSSEVARTNESWRYVSFYKYTHHCHVWLLSVHSCFGYYLYSILSSMTFIWNIRVPSAYILNVQCVSIISELSVSGTCGDWRTKFKKKHGIIVKDDYREFKGQPTVCNTPIYISVIALCITVLVSIFHAELSCRPLQSLLNIFYMSGEITALAIAWVCALLEFTIICRNCIRIIAFHYTMSSRVTDMVQPLSREMFDILTTFNPNKLLSSTYPFCI